MVLRWYTALLRVRREPKAIGVQYTLLLLNAYFTKAFLFGSSFTMYGLLTSSLHRAEDLRINAV